MISVYNESLICDCDGAEILRPWLFVVVCEQYEHTRRHFVYPNPSLVLGGVCRSATTALLMYVSLAAYTITLTAT